MGYRGDRRPIPNSNGRSLDDVRSRISGLHFAKEQLSDGETEILFLAECLLRYIDANDEEPYSHGRWPWSHRYVVVGVSWYDSITGPMSVIQGRCSCGRTSSWTERGQWTMAQLDVRRAAGERTV